MQPRLEKSTAQALLALRYNSHYQTLAQYLSVCLNETHKRLVASNDHHETLRLQGEARSLNETLNLIDRAEDVLTAFNK